MIWVVTLTYDLTANEDLMDAWAERLDEVDGSVAAVPGTGITVTLWEQCTDPIKASLIASDTAYEIVHATPVAVEVVTEDEHLRRADAPTLPEMVSGPEVAEMLHVSRQRVVQLRSNQSFPAPLLELRTGPIWSRVAIEKFASEWERKPGRPKIASMPRAAAAKG